MAGWLAKDGQLLIPLVELLEKGERAIDEVIDVMGRATIEAVLQMSAVQVAGPKEQGRRDADRELYWHGTQTGRVALQSDGVDACTFLDGDPGMLRESGRPPGATRVDAVFRALERIVPRRPSHRWMPCGEYSAAVTKRTR